MLDRKIKRIMAYLYSHLYHRPGHIKPDEASSISRRTFSHTYLYCTVAAQMGTEVGKILWCRLPQAIPRKDAL